MKLNSINLYEILKEHFPSQNDDYESDYIEDLSELIKFGIDDTDTLNSLISKHFVELMEFDRTPLTDFEREHMIEEHGMDFVLNREHKKYWLSYPALLRTVMEVEFGDEYEEYMASKAIEE